MLCYLQGPCFLAENASPKPRPRRGVCPRGAVEWGARSCFGQCHRRAGLAQVELVGGPEASQTRHASVWSVWSRKRPFLLWKRNNTITWPSEAVPYEERIKECEWLTRSFIRISLNRGILSFLFLYLLGFGRETGSQRFGERSIHSVIVNSLCCVSKYFPKSWGGGEVGVWKTETSCPPQLR